MPAYDNQNVFAKILRGEIPNHTLFEDDHTLCFMDVMPRCDGHCLVIPKAASRNLLDIGVDDLSHVMASVQKIMRAVKTAFNGDGVTILQFNEAASGQEVFHTHFHVIPRHDGVKLGPHTGTMADQSLLAEHAKLIIAAL